MPGCLNDISQRLTLSCSVIDDSEVKVLEGVVSFMSPE